ncbi:hypothetical protein SAMN05216360_103115 [Methylobacterium phyllostachyos]|uniref:Uncharacterized protein n=1 Tax=Methylobacterium phyllostachyos TaxID=582672 RepID=A0A1G9V9J5_9HYPH|nr:hypothetical protein [Methylobacterium phyllostachyos]SDM68839.1 hypothetical protein SAMN05216360_103115 [Methylobacterium phyllostachyos]
MTAEKDLTRHPVWGAAAETERVNPFAGRFPVVKTITRADGTETVLTSRPQPAMPKAATAHIQDDHERMLRLVLDILYDERLSAEEKVARAGNSPGFDPVRDGRPYLPWPPRAKAAALPATGSFHG